MPLVHLPYPPKIPTSLSTQLHTPKHPLPKNPQPPIISPPEICAKSPKVPSRGNYPNGCEARDPGMVMSRYRRIPGPCILWFRLEQEPGDQKNCPSPHSPSVSHSSPPKNLSFLARRRGVGGGENFRDDVFAIRSVALYTFGDFNAVNIHRGLKRLRTCHCALLSGLFLEGVGSVTEAWPLLR